MTQPPMHQFARIHPRTHAEEPDASPVKDTRATQPTPKPTLEDTASATAAPRGSMADRAAADETAPSPPVVATSQAVAAPSPSNASPSPSTTAPSPAVPSITPTPPAAPSEAPAAPNASHLTHAPSLAALDDTYEDDDGDDVDLLGASGHKPLAHEPPLPPPEPSDSVDLSASRPPLKIPPGLLVQLSGELNLGEQGQYINA